MERLDNLTIPQDRLLCIISFIVSRFVYLGRLRFPFDESPLTYFVQMAQAQGALSRPGPLIVFADLGNRVVQT